MYVAWDLETCPLPRAGFSARQRRRLDMLVRRERQRRPDLTAEEASRKACSLHPALGWICCLSVVGADDPAHPRTPKSYVAATPEEEPGLLQAFWDDLDRLPRRVRWLTFNGKRFDVEFVLTRSLVWEIVPTRQDLLCRHPYRDRPHTDLCTFWRGSAMGLADACDLLGVASPKEAMDGGDVGAVLEAEGAEAVARYCEADVLATMRCYARMGPVLH